MRRVRIPTKCKVCGALFETRPSEVGNIVTCSKECSVKRRSLWKTGRPHSLAHKAAISAAALGKKCPWNVKRQVTKKCASCDVEFSVPKSREGSARFCSVACWREKPKKLEVMGCTNCARQFGRYASCRIGSRVFCSHSCRVDFQKGANSPAWRGGFTLTRRVATGLRTRLRAAIKNHQQAGLAIELLGCTVERVIEHLEGQFVGEMTWDNWSQYGWHIDHIQPLASFDLTDPAQVARACHYSNLQPLWWRDNIKKGAKHGVAAQIRVVMR